MSSVESILGGRVEAILLNPRLEVDTGRCATGVLLAVQQTSRVAAPLKESNRMSSSVDGRRDRKLKNVEHVENWHASGSLMALARRYPEALRTNTPHFWALSRLELQHYRSHSSYLS
ncbi:hypothetical protein Agabi119p4_6871 [Agaricus bisporus var. burnettii]|uniref:Uncharacterized protein n=1 Tax=Agaricus bisporus var. burnettii TaxID=192524 RepID=A0A8H7KD51_AGABI|nr:hypothetical protein Agabi119p4_6871 [Agaricus bisporus var. burnettii]